MPTVPNNFDGDKFLSKFNLKEGHFYILGDQLICKSLPNLTDTDLLDCVVDMDAYNAKNTEIENSRITLRNEYLSSINILQNIEDTQSPTNAQIITAIKAIARILKFMLKARNL